MINILSDIEGPSILALRYVISQSGLVAIATLIIFPFITYYTGAILIRPVYTGDFCRSNSVQFLSRRSCNFKIARVNHCDFGAMLAIYRRGMRYNSRNTVTLRNSFTFQQAHSFCLSNRRALTFILTNCTKIAMKSQLVATSARQKLH